MREGTFGEGTFGEKKNKKKKPNNTTQWLNDCMFKRLVEPNRKQDVDANQDAETTDVDVIEWEKPVMLVNVSHARRKMKTALMSLMSFETRPVYLMEKSKII